MSSALSGAILSIFLKDHMPRRDDTDTRYMMLGFRIFLEFGAIIAVPVVLLAWFGKYLDGIYGTGPILMIAGFVLAFVISAVSIVKKARRFAQEYEAIGRGKDDKKGDMTAR